VQFGKSSKHASLGVEKLERFTWDGDVRTTLLTVNKLKNAFEIMLTLCFPFLSFSPNGSKRHVSQGLNVLSTKIED